MSPTTTAATPSTAGPAPPKPAPWKRSFNDAVSQMDSPEFVLSTLTEAPPAEHTTATASSTSSSTSPPPYVPRARFCVFRGFWAEMPPNKLNPAPANPRAFESDLFTFTTDVRMRKAGELFRSGSGEQSQGSGGGGPVEAVWWAKAALVQWRVRGHAYVVAPDIDSDGGGDGVRTVKSEVGAWMRPVRRDAEAETDGAWSWTTELDAHFGNLSPGMRGSFKAPPPGRPTSEPFDREKYKLGTKVNDIHDAVARENFRVVVIKPDWVERTDVSGTEGARRLQYAYQPATGDWAVTETWP